MPLLTCTSRLEGIGPLNPQLLSGHTVEQLLTSAGNTYPRLQHYVLDDQGKVRQHVAIFVDGVLTSRESALTTPLSEHSEVYLMQALSGG